MTSAEVLEQYASGRRDFVGFRLVGADFTGADLTGANFSNANLTGASFKHAELVEASFSCADARFSNFDFAQLFDADLDQADFTGASLVNADATDAHLSGALFIGADLNNMCMSGAKMMCRSGSTNGSTNFSNAYMKYTHLDGVDIRNASHLKRLDMVDLRGFHPFAVHHDAGWMIASGCRWYTVPEALDHWGESYNGGRTNGDRYIRAINALMQDEQDEQDARFEQDEQDAPSYKTV